MTRMNCVENSMGNFDFMAKTGTGVPVILAPMAGITDRPFRSLVARFGVDLVISEMIASQDLLTDRAGTRAKAELGYGDQKTAVQLAGREPYWMAEAARMAEDNGASIIDINMGCPAKKVVTGYSGSALLRDLDHAMRLIEAVLTSVSVPVTLKTRLGWDESCHNAPELAARAEAAGIKMITIHGRTRCQFYKGEANWNAVAKVKQIVSIPVIVNGDIQNTCTAQRAISAAKADGVMVGRAVRGQPWLLRDIRTELSATVETSLDLPVDLSSLVREHYQDMLSFYGAELGQRVARKHLGWYMDTAKTPKELRREMLTCEETSQVEALMPYAFDTYREAA